LLAAQLERAVAKEVASRALSAGLVVNAITDSALRLAPPLLVSPTETEEALTILGKVLAEVLADERLAEADTR
jgi:acetylornithine/succinyldiaminopimelate/putrescine aminotransferase